MSSREPEGVGAEMYACVADLYPLCRSITGDGLRETLRRIGRILPLTLHEVPSGTRVFDWIVPPEWNVRDAWVKSPRGERVIDFRRSNLHVVGYSVPVRARLSLAELRPHLHTLPERPDWIPYRTSYYEPAWGFCLRHRDMIALPEGEYEVCIDASLEPGHLTYGECVLPGSTTGEVLISCHACHPSLCNDNLSGVVVAAFLGRVLAARPRRFTYRFLFVPGTIGSIAWLALHEADVERIRHGLVLSCLGDAGRPTYKRSRRGDAEIDRVVRHVLAAQGSDHAIADFAPWGYDERQYCSPGFDLPVGCLMRTPHGTFPEYHTSADDLDFVRPAALADSLALCERIVAVLEANRSWTSRNPKGEPQLGRRGLYGLLGGTGRSESELAMLWILNLADARHDLLAVAERSGIAFDVVARTAALLSEQGLLEETDVAAGHGGPA
jgi:aminopeptidase-like protein